MSIAEFSAALKNKANTSAQQRLLTMQNRLLEFSNQAYRSRNDMVKAASILNPSSDAFRAAGEKQGRTRLVFTKESIGAIFKSFAPNLPSEKALEYYLRFLVTNFPEYKSKHFEVYDSTGTNILAGSRKKLANVLTDEVISTAVAYRGLNFSHSNSLNHLVQFLKSPEVGAFAGVSAENAKKMITALYERGHIYAQTTGRQIVSVGGINKEMDILDRIVKLSMDLDIASSTISNKPIYSQLEAAIRKDFNPDGRLFMNIEFQEKFSADGIGNQDTGKITKGLQILSSLIKLLSTEYDSKNTKLVGIPKTGLVSEAAKSFDNLVKKLERYNEEMVKVLSGFYDKPEEYLLDLRSSPSAKEFILTSVTDRILGKKTKPVKVNIKNQTVYSKKQRGQKIPKMSELQVSGKKLKAELQQIKNSISKNSTLPPLTSVVNLNNLQNLLNANLVDRVKQNMGDGNARNVLNLRTGRFAESVKVERLSESRAGMITAFYSYMKNPYATFSEGGRQQYPKTRDPKLLISKSIREIASAQVANRLRAVLV